VSNDGRLTRQELGRLLAHEARGSAQALRGDVVELRPAPESETPSEAPSEEEEPPESVGSSMDALGDMIAVLSQARDRRNRVRRGRLDVAALLFEVAPSARTTVEPGAGTEVYADETELRRMFGILLGTSHQRTWAPEVEIRREGEWVRIRVELGPDLPNAEVERRWLTRMAARHGGRYELDGRYHTVSLQADGALNRAELTELKQELVQAQLLGETYAREIASLYEPKHDSGIPTTDRDIAFRSLSRLAAALAAPLRQVFEGLNLDSREATSVLGNDSPTARALAKKVSKGFDVVQELHRLASCPSDEARAGVDLAGLAQHAIAEAQRRAARLGVFFEFHAGDVDVQCHTKPGCASLVVHSLIEYAVDASPKGGTVRVRVRSSERGVELCISDEGSRVALRRVGRGPARGLLPARPG
jgi:two-component system OmpR family sensor kinase